MQEKRDFLYVRNHILESRLKKVKNKYNFTEKNGKQIKRLLGIFLAEEILAAWDIFLQDLMDDPDRFWRKGYTVDLFCANQCFTVCQEHSLYKRYVMEHRKKIDDFCEDKSQTTIYDFIK